MGRVGGKNSCGLFWNHKNYFLKTSQNVPWLYRKKQHNPQSTEILEPIYTKIWRSKTKVATKAHRCFTVYLYKIISLKYWDIHPYFLWSFTVLVWKVHGFPKSRMFTFQTWNKKNGIKNSITGLYLNVRMRISRALGK